MTRHVMEVADACSDGRDHLAMVVRVRHDV